MICLYVEYSKQNMVIENNVAKYFSISYDIIYNYFRTFVSERRNHIVDYYSKDFNTNDVKLTKNRKLILEMIDQHDVPITAEELFFAIKQSSSMSLSTVYRILGFLSEHGILLKNTGMDGKNYYQRNRVQHSHNLICKACNAVITLPHCPMNEIEKSIHEKTGYTIISHNLEFIGICPKCNKKFEKQKNKAIL